MLAVPYQITDTYDKYKLVGLLECDPNNLHFPSLRFYLLYTQLQPFVDFLLKKQGI